jgi:RNA polymerase sigma-70 factor (ECF subfamily)
VGKGDVDIGRDAALVERFQAGYQGAFDELFRHYFDRLTAYCARRVGDLGEAEEIAQEAFVRALVALPRFDGERRFYPWICVIASNLCSKAISAPLRTQADLVDEPHYDQRLDGLIEGVDHALLRSAMAKLPDRHREALELWAEGTSSAEIAAHLGCTPGNADVLVHRARHRLRERYLILSGEHSRWALVPGAPALRRLVERIRGRVFGWLTQNPDLVSFPTAKAVAILTAISLSSGSSVPGLVASRVGRAGAQPLAAAMPVADPSGRSGRPSAVADRAPRPGAARVGGERSPHPAPSDATSVLGPKFGIGPVSGSEIPEGTVVLGFTRSPRYEQDHEVYASGFLTRCTTGLCPTLFHSIDGGTTWTRVRYLGPEVGFVMFPPSYPADKRLFLAGTRALYVSSDGGQTVTPVAAVGGSAVMSPAFSSGDPEILVGGTPGWIYHDDSKAVMPFDARSGTSDPLTFSYAPSYPADHRILVGRAESTPEWQSIVSLCDGSVCKPPVVLAGSNGTPGVMASRRYSSSGVAYAWSVDRMYRTTDGAASFARIAMPAKGSIEAVADDPAGRLYVALANLDAQGTSGGVFRSDDAGITWARLGAGTSLDRGVISLAALPGDRLLAGLRPEHGGLLCSSDGGKSWAPRCP